MTVISLRDIGRYGVVRDLAEHSIPPEAWSTARNVAFIDGYITRSLGEIQVEGEPTVNPYYVFPAPTVDAAYWCYTDTNKVYAVAGGVHSNITRQTAAVDVDYNGGVYDKWNGGWLNGVLVLNNSGVDAPQQWMPMSVATKLTALANFTTTGVTTLRAKVIRPFRNFLIALYIVKDGNAFPTMVKWSHPADPGNVPSSWDAADTTKISGESTPGTTPGFLVDCKPLGIANMLYKEDAVIRMERIQTNDIFGFTEISDRTGLAGQDCAQTLKPGQQVFLTTDADAVVTDGRSIESITDKKVRRHLETSIDQNQIAKAFIVVDYAKRQVMICYPRVGSLQCNEMAVWDMRDATWVFRDLTQTLDIKTGFYDQTQSLRRWSDMTATPWSAMNEPWDVRAFAVGAYKLIGGFNVADQLREVNRGYQLGGQGYLSYVERYGLGLGQDREGRPRADFTRIKLVRKIRPLIQAPQPVNMQIQVGAQEYPHGPVTWQGPHVFNSASDRFMDFNIAGRLNAIRFLTSDEVDWRLYGYDIDIEPMGEHM